MFALLIIVDDRALIVVVGVVYIPGTTRVAIILYHIWRFWLKLPLGVPGSILRVGGYDYE